MSAMSVIESDFQIVCNLLQLEGRDLFWWERRNHIGELIYGPIVRQRPAVRILSLLSPFLRWMELRARANHAAGLALLC
jgi:hypothetical protein